MGKKAKMFKAFVSGLLAVSLAFAAPSEDTLKAEAAQFQGGFFRCRLCG